MRVNNSIYYLISTFVASFYLTLIKVEQKQSLMLYNAEHVENWFYDDPCCFECHESSVFTTLYCLIYMVQQNKKMAKEFNKKIILPYYRIHGFKLILNEVDYKYLLEESIEFVINYMNDCPENIKKYIMNIAADCYLQTYWNSGIIMNNYTFKMQGMLFDFMNKDVVFVVECLLQRCSLDENNKESSLSINKDLKNAPKSILGFAMHFKKQMFKDYLDEYVKSKGR